MKNYTVKSPVLIIFYNRADKAKNILENLIKSKNKFSKLYFRVDGPKDSKDKFKVKQVIRTLKLYKKFFKCVSVSLEKKNLGLQRNIIKSIDMVLNKNDRIIILEDDQLISDNFFKFCDLMLEKFNNEKKIFSISASCYLPNSLKKDDIFFSKFPDCVGWATWKKSWSKLKRKYSFYDIYKKGIVKKYYNNISIEHWFYEYLYREYVAKKKGLWSTWWQLAIICENGLSINPMRNLAIHDGLDKDSNAEHFDKSYLVKKYIRCDNLQVNKIKNYNVLHSKYLDQFNFEMIKKTDPAFKIINRIKWFLLFYNRVLSLKNKYVKIQM
jgi:GR25 family glycosyltransferase involved in LPS biosynthesis